MGWIILLFGGVFMNLKRDTYAIVDLDHLKYNVELAHSEFKRPLMAVIISMLLTLLKDMF